MALVRMQVSVRDDVLTQTKDAIVNTLYFNVSGSVDDPNYTSLVNDLYTIWAAQPWTLGRYLDIRAYNMADDKPRPVKAQKMGAVTGTKVLGVPQVALCLSYYADRNLPRQRGRIFIGPWSNAVTSTRPATAQQNTLIQLGQSLSGLGGLNVDWSLYSPTTQQHTRISNIWVDNSWDIIRSRKLAGTSRVTAEING